MYVKLFGSILDSSVWIGTDPITKVVWITMLAMANEHGMVEASSLGIAHRAGVPIEECERVLEVLESPDPRSRTEDHDGRRVERLSGGWALLNYEKYRSIRTKKQMLDAARQRRFRGKDPK